MSDDIRSSDRETESCLRMARESSDFYEGLARALEALESHLPAEPAKSLIRFVRRPIGAASVRRYAD